MQPLVQTRPAEEMAARSDHRLVGHLKADVALKHGSALATVRRLILGTHHGTIVNHLILLDGILHGLLLRRFQCSLVVRARGLGAERRKV